MTIEQLNLPTVLGTTAPQVSLASLQESLLGYGFLTMAQYIADLFFAVRDIHGVQAAKFPAMTCYSDPDYWLAGLLLAFDAHQNAPPTRAGRLPVVLGSPNSDKVGGRGSTGQNY